MHISDVQFVYVTPIDRDVIFDLKCVTYVIYGTGRLIRLSHTEVIKEPIPFFLYKRKVKTNENN